jgi:hypothetical protein
MSLLDRFLDSLLAWLTKPAKSRPLPPVRPIKGRTGPRPSY